jgi:hypothetical protein
VDRALAENAKGYCSMLMTLKDTALTDEIIKDALFPAEDSK